MDSFYPTEPNQNPPSSFSPPPPPPRFAPPPPPQNPPPSPPSVNNFPSAGQPQPPQMPMGTPNRAPWAAIIAGILFVGVGGGFAYAYFYTSLFRSPEEIFAKAIKNFVSAKTYEYTSSMNLEMNFGDLAGPPKGFFAGPAKLTVDSNGAIDSTNSKSPKMALKNKGSFEMNLGGIGINVKGGVDAIVVDKKIYLKLDLPQIFQMLGLGNQDEWLLVEAPKDDPVSQKVLEEAMSKNAEFIAKVKEALENRKFIKVARELSSERVDGRATYHYALAIDKEAIRSFYLELVKSMSPDVRLEPEDIKIFEQVFDGLEIKKSEIWIDKADNFPRKISFDVSLKLNLDTFRARLGAYPPSGEKQGSIEYMFRGEVFYKNFNKPVSITPPEHAKTITQVMEEESNRPGSSIFTARRKGQDAKIKADLSMLRVTAELYYDQHGSYGKPMRVQTCPVSESIAYGFFGSAEAQKTLKDITSVGLSGPILCVLEGIGSPSKYAISAPLKTVLGHYWCVDSSGASQETLRPITSAKCPEGIKSPGYRQIVPLVR